MADLILATRGSELALVQTRLVREGLLRAWPQLEVREEIVRTTGDKRPAEELTALGGSGVFTKELENALLEKRAHAAVHSLKDLPVELPAGLVLAAVLRRADAGDVLVSSRPGGAEALSSGARIGTGSPRRAGMMRALRRDAEIVPVRGNVPTRIGLVAGGKFDAVILAAAGLERLGLPTDGEFLRDGVVLHAAPLATFLPAPGQGAIAVETLEDDHVTRKRLRVLHDEDTAAAVTAERAVLRALGGGCHLALGAWGRVVEGRLHLQAVLFDGSGAGPKMAAQSAPLEDAEELGRAVAAELRV
jgi:hydroxymethylbilane synthase